MFLITIRLRDGQQLEVSVDDAAREEFEGEFAEDAGILRITLDTGVLVVVQSEIVWYRISNA